jgi:hypothetical protein
MKASPPDRSGAVAGTYCTSPDSYSLVTRSLICRMNPAKPCSPRLARNVPPMSNPPAMVTMARTRLSRAAVETA